MASLGVSAILLRSLGVIVAFVVLRFLRRTYIERMRIRSLRAQGIPMLPHSLVFGHLPVLGQFRKEHPPDVNIYMMHNWLVRNLDRYFPGHKKVPPLVYLDLWPMAGSLVMAYDAAAASQFTQSPSLPKDPVTRMFMEPLTGGNDLVSTEGAIWKTWRTRFSPGFSPRNLSALLPELLEEAQVFVNGLRNLAGKDGEWGPVFKLEEKTTNLTFDIITRASLDMRLHEQSRQSDSPFKSALMSQIKIMGMVTKVVQIIRLDKLPWYHATISRNNSVMHKVLVSQIENKLRSDAGASVQGKKTIVDLAIKHVDKDAGAGASRGKPDAAFMLHLIANLKAFIFAGHDTTASTICFMTKLLQDNPDCLARLRAEHDAVLGPDPERAGEVLAASPHLLYALPYTLGVIKETLRLFPLAATVRDGNHVPGYALTVPGSTTKYPTRGFGPWLAAPGIQRNADYWPRPDAFLPQRWTVPEGDPLYAAREAWTPFSLGPRNCIGMELAMVELRLVAVLVARTFDVREAWAEWDAKQGPKATPSHVVDGERLYCIGDGTVHPKDGMPVVVRLRTHGSSP
ncbi:cytochrome P450 4V3 [Durotheca rogersii]|uniref:cytochrome P450 4V3 n=1 Tax=Durotheca rogersii TaxID=419775 RepID=UPI00222000B0|nr:cytochrome P450 4V3 [Durotheca rogersii]KAI5863873.1 cytochrome P450 4V3 [Durotheca rogersii]